MAKVRIVGQAYKGPKPTAGLGSASRGRSVAGAFRQKRAPNPFSKARRLETLGAGYRRITK